MVTVREFKVPDYSWSEKMFTRVLESLPEVVSRLRSFRKTKRDVNQAAKELSFLHENKKIYESIGRILNLQKKSERQRNGTAERVIDQMERENILYKKLAEKEKKSVEEVKSRVEATFKSSGKVLMESEELEFREKEKALNERLKGIVYHRGSPVTYDELTYFILTVRKVFGTLTLVVKLPLYLVKLGVTISKEIPPEDVQRVRRKVIRCLARMSKPQRRKIKVIEEELLLEEGQKDGELSAEEEMEAEERGGIILDGLIEKWKDKHIH